MNDLFSDLPEPVAAPVFIAPEVKKIDEPKDESEGDVNKYQSPEYPSLFMRND